MNNLFSFEQTPWEIASATLRSGDKLSAMRFMTLLEGEDEETVQDALQTLEELTVTLDVADLPRDYGCGETEKRLRLEEKLAAAALRPDSLPEGDPLRLYLEEMAAIPVCGDIAVLAMELAQANEAQTLDAPVQKRLADLSLSRVVQLAGEFTGRGVLLLDLIQEGSLGLWNGILTYGYGQNFEAVRDWWIRQYMARAVVLQARSGGVGQKLRRALEDYRAADRRLLTQLGRNPTTEEIAREMGVNGEDAQVYADMLDAARLMEKAHAPKAEETPEDDQTVEDTAYFQSRQRIADMLSQLTQLEARVINLRFGLEGGVSCTPQDTGAKLGLTADEVVQMEASALAKLRKQ